MTLNPSRSPSRPICDARVQAQDPGLRHVLKLKREELPGHRRRLDEVAEVAVEEGRVQAEPSSYACGGPDFARPRPLSGQREVRDDVEAELRGLGILLRRTRAPGIRG